MTGTIDTGGISQRYSFPEELLKSNNEDRKKYFKDFIVDHRFLTIAINNTVNSITNHVSESLIFVCGPSGVGKKELIRGVIEKLESTAELKQLNNPGCIPVVYVEAQAPQQGSFNFNNLCRTALVNMGEPMLNSKIYYKEMQSLNSVGQIINISKMQKADYPYILQNALRYRQVSVLIINEAHHMLRMSGSKKLNWSLDLLKSLTNGSQVPIVLVGTYALLTYLLDLDQGITDQINQRTIIINFPRYNQENDEEVSIFVKVAKMLLVNMPLKKTAEHLVDNDWRYFYRYTLGNIGSLKNWLMRAYSLALESESSTLKKEHLEQTKITGLRSSAMLKSIMEGEIMMKDLQSDGEINMKLKFNEMQSKTPSNSNKQNSLEIKAKPFERKAKRDDVINR